MARIVSVQTGVVRPLRVGERRVLSAIGKTPVGGAVAVGPLGLAGDEQADPAYHGGLDKAVYAYPVEHLPTGKSVALSEGIKRSATSATAPSMEQKKKNFDFGIEAS